MRVSEEQPWATYYPATVYDVAMVLDGGGIWAYGDCGNGAGTFAATSLHIIDTPISIATDTLCLPLDAWRKWKTDHPTRPTTSQ